MTRYVTIGGAHSRRVTEVTADMAWLGDPPTDEQAQRYERVRQGRHIAAVYLESSALATESRQLMIDISAAESPVRRAKLIERLQAVNAQASRLRIENI
jgi:hypothetical protein